MKQKLVIAIISLAMATTAKANTVAIPEGFYPHMGIVTDITETGNLYEITFADAVGRSWAWLDTNGDWFPGDYVAVIMYDNGTETVYDDFVMDAHYVGYKEMF